MTTAEIAAWTSGATVVIGAIAAAAVKLARALVGRLGANLGPRTNELEKDVAYLEGRLDERQGQPRRKKRDRNGGGGARAR